jgi:hypothetical protein
MNYIINDGKVYEATPPFNQVGEITEGPVTILTLDEPKQRKPRKPREAPLEIPAQET